VQMRGRVLLIVCLPCRGLAGVVGSCRVPVCCVCPLCHIRHVQFGGTVLLRLPPNNSTKGATEAIGLKAERQREISQKKINKIEESQ
jgi:hypothetical protein